MEHEIYIENTPLPLTQQFEELKKQSLDYLQSVCGERWTNLNETDPGITILEQVIYALTELGYCADFPIQDLLTHANGHIDFDNQFSHPQDILTTSPVTPKDYIKYVVDQVEQIERLMMTVIDKSDLLAYQALIPPAREELNKLATKGGQFNLPDWPSARQEAVWYALNQVRNLDELFYCPTYLQPKVCKVTGQLTIESSQDLYKVMFEVMDAVDQYLFPNVAQSGYDDLVQAGYHTSQIFNGPKLQNGWIITNEIGRKKNQLTIQELTQVILSIPGVTMANSLVFEMQEEKDTPYHVCCNPTEMLVINLFGKSMRINGKSVTEALPDLPKHLKMYELGEQEHKGVNTSSMHPGYSKGSYRDVEDYYSIQMTMPEVFGLGESIDATQETKENLALHRQLVAYLSLFDQVLANYFSQLANVGHLFSFRTPTTGAPSDENRFYQIRDREARHSLKRPVPYQYFAPTYYYQSLYQAVPNLRPILKNNDAFDFSAQPLTESESNHQSWVAYQQAPYNAYIYGLMQITEDATENLQRRNQMLDHLLARHGGAPEVLDKIIEGTIYSGDRDMDRILIKGVYLQNYTLYSYYRAKAYNFLGADKLERYSPEDCRDKVESIRDPHYTYENILTSRQNDFIFDAGQFERRYRVGERDFRNYSAIELQVHLFMGLDTLYENLILNLEEALAKKERRLEGASGKNKTTLAEDIQSLKTQRCQVLWFLQQRKGLVLLENRLISEDEQAIIYKKMEDETGNKPSYKFYKSKKEYSLKEAIRYCKKGASKMCFKDVPEKEVGWLSFDRINDQSPNEYAITIWENSFNYDWAGSALSFIIPKYLWGGKALNQSIDGSQTPDRSILKAEEAFLNRLNQLLQYHLAIHLSWQIDLMSEDRLGHFIPHFVRFHNDLRYVKEKDCSGDGASMSNDTKTDDD